MLMHSQWSDLAREPHARCTQIQSSSLRWVPFEVIHTDTVDSTIAACIVPESPAVEHCTVVAVAAVDPRVVVSVVRGEHHSVVVAECVAPGVTRVARHLKLVVAWLSMQSKPAVLGPVPAGVECLHLKSQFVATTECQLTEPLVANPVVTIRVVKPDCELRPRNDWRIWIRRHFAGLAPECSWLHNTQWYQLLNNMTPKTCSSIIRLNYICRPYLCQVVVN